MEYNDQILKMIKNGNSAREICDTLGISLISLRNIVNELNKRGYDVSKFTIDDDIKYQVLDLIKMRKTSSMICKELGISSIDLFQIIKLLEDKGFRFTKVYFSDGNIKYLACEGEGDIQNPTSKSVKLLTNFEENDMDFLVISDIHAGNACENFEMVRRTFEYCKKNNIHIIFNTGDFIDGTFGKHRKSIKDCEKQIEHFIENYPSDSHILTFGVGGGHDFSTEKDLGIDFLKMLKMYRHDIVVPSYEHVYVKIKNDTIDLHHTLDGTYPLTTGGDYAMSLNGHMHQYINNGINRNNQLCIAVPSLSDLSNDVPSVLHMSLHFTHGYIDKITTKQIYFGNRDMVLREDTACISPFNDWVHVRNTDSYTRDDSFDETVSKEETAEEYVETSKPKTRVLSQIDKFNRRYGKTSKENE